MQVAITDLNVITGKNSSIEAEHDFVKIPADLNRGAGGDFIYLCLKKGTETEDTKFIRGIKIIMNDEPTPDGYEKIKVDLNKSVGGDYMYLCFSRDESQGKPISDIIVRLAWNEKYKTAPSYNGVNYKEVKYNDELVNLNEGVSSSAAVYMYYTDQTIPDEKKPDWYSVPVTRQKLKTMIRKGEEFEVSRAQLSSDGGGAEAKMLVRLQKPERVATWFITPDINESEFVQTKTTGAAKEEIETFSIEIGSSIGLSASKFSNEINNKLGYSRTTSYETSEENQEQDKITYSKADYDRVGTYYRLVEILRTVNIPKGNILSEIKSATANRGGFITPVSIGLKADNEKFISANLNEDGKLFANGDSLDKSETFKLIEEDDEVEEGKVVLQSNNGQYVSIADEGNKKFLVANGNSLDSSTHFTIEELKHNRIALQTNDKQYIVANPDGELKLVDFSDGDKQKNLPSKAIFDITYLDNVKVEEV